MSLGDHLAELQRRLVWPVLTVVAAFLVCFSFQATLKAWFIQPLLKAIEIVGPAQAARVHLNAEEGTRILQVLHLSESAMTSMSVAFSAALVLAIPVLLWHAWKFIATGLKENERSLAFLFVPLGVIFFYIGGALGFFWGLPYYYAWLIEWAVHDPTIKELQIRQYEYWDQFQFMTVVFGLLFDIPWLVMVVVRVGLVTPDKLASWRKGILIINAVICGIVAPPDATSMLVMMIPVQLLFESGLLLSRFMMWNVERKRRRAVAKAENQDPT
jgi:sec-independent protein translocase protein TatC